MNERQRISYWREYDRRQKSWERRFYPLAIRAIRSQIKEFFEYLRANGKYAALNHQLDKTPVKVLVRQIWRTAGVTQANFVYEDVKSQVKRLGFNQRWTDVILYYLQNYAGEKITLITDTTRRDILKMLAEGETEGLTYQEIEKKLLADFTQGRAQKIVRTESVGASNFGALVAAYELGIDLKKEWITARDNRVRHSHKQLDGETVWLDEQFTNGLSFPGDPIGTAAEVINCRCVLGFVPQKDDRGAVQQRPRNQIDLRNPIAQIFLELGLTALLNNLINQDEPSHI